MMDKLLRSRIVMPVLAVVMAASLLVGVAAAAYPAARQSERIEEITRGEVTNLYTLSLSITALGEDRLNALANMPMQGNDFKKLSGLLTEVKEASGYARVYLVGLLDGQVVTLCDSDYRDTGTSGLTYFAPGARLEDPLADSLSAELKRVLNGKSDYAASRKPFDRGEDGLFLGGIVPVRDRNGAVKAALIGEMPAADINFTRLGFLDLELVSYLGFLLFALSLAALVLLRRLARRSRMKQMVEPEPVDSTAEAFEAPQLTDAADPAPGSSEPAGTEPPEEEPRTDDTAEPTPKEE